MERTIELAAAPDEVWGSLPSLLGDDVELVAEPGGPVRARGPEGERAGTVDEADAPHRLAFWWVPVVGDEAPSFVEIELAGGAVGTRLTVRETRFDAAVVVDGLLRGPLARARA